MPTSVWYSQLQTVVADEASNSSVVADYARLLSLAVHEFRTPASVVGGYLRMLRRDTNSPLSDPQRKMVGEAEKSCARIVELINELGEVATLDGGTAAVTDAPFDLFGVILEVANGVREAADRGVRLEVRGDEAGAPMVGDLPRLRAALSALFRAVLREQPAACTVVVERRRRDAAPQSPAVIVVARDSDVQHAYAAAHLPFDEHRGGLGLALPIARRVVERHGGHVWTPAPVDGDNIAGRSSIVISLPLRIVREQTL